MSELESHKVATVDQDYHVYVAIWEAVVTWTDTALQEGDNIHDPYTVKTNDTPIDNDAAVLHEIFCG